MKPEEMDYHDLKVYVHNLNKLLAVKAEEYWRNAGYETIDLGYVSLDDYEPLTDDEIKTIVQVVTPQFVTSEDYDLVMAVEKVVLEKLKNEPKKHMP
jgi:hypothetical protein